jgi:hypothetical protein
VGRFINTVAAMTLQRIIDTMVGRGYAPILIATPSRHLATEPIT